MPDYGFILLIAAAVGTVALLISRSKAKAVTASTIDAAHALGQKALDIADGLRNTVHQQAQVIASPPVQAAINAGPPAVAQTVQPASAPSSAAAPQPSPAPTAPATAPQSIQPPPQVKVDPKDPTAPPIATTQPAPPPALPMGDQATREKVALAVAFGYGSPPYKALAAQFVNVAAVINQYRAGGPDTDPTFNASHASPRDYGYQWNHGAWVSPADAVGGNWNPATQRFE